jgi:hypothetical protein
MAPAASWRKSHAPRQHPGSLQPLPPQAASGAPQPQSQNVSVWATMPQVHALGSGSGSHDFHARSVVKHASHVGAMQPGAVQLWPAQSASVAPQPQSQCPSAQSALAHSHVSGAGPGFA